MPDVAPGCTTAGSVAYWQWLSCEKYYADESADNELGVKDISLPAVGHCFKATVVAPTCTENGRTLYKCEFCDESYIDKVVEKLGHDFVEFAEESSPTCTANGNLTTPLVESEDLTVGGDVSAVYKYTYDANGNITEIRGRNNELHSSYEYDGLNRLIRENVAGLTITLYFYDDYGNLSYKKTFSYQDYIDSPTSVLRSNMTAPTVSYRYDTAGNMKRLCSYGSSKIITYDNFGNPLQWFKHSSIDARVGYDLSWSKMNRLTGVTDLETKERCEYTYNHSGIRTGKKVGNTVYKYYLDGSSIIAETRTTGSKVDTLKYYYGATGLIGFNYNGTDYYYKKNTRGDILRIYNGAGEACGQYRYDAWGKCVVEWDPYGIAAVNPFRYRSYYLDNETGLCYLNSRYYDSAVGRFLSPDSLDYLDPETIGGLNLYAYCYNNPVNYYDPSGHIVVSLIVTLMIVGGIIGALMGGLIAGMVSYDNGDRGWSLFGHIMLGALFGGAVGVAAGFVLGVLGPTVGGMGAMVLGEAMGMSGAFAAVGVAVEVLAAAGAGVLVAAGAGALGNVRFSKWEPGSWPGDDPTVSPGDGFEWRGPSEVGGPYGDWYNSATGDQLHPDLNHSLPKGPHWGWRNKLRRIFKDIFK